MTDAPQETALQWSKRQLDAIAGSPLTDEQVIALTQAYASLAIAEELAALKTATEALRSPLEAFLGVFGLAGPAQSPQNAVSGTEDPPEEQ